MKAAYERTMEQSSLSFQVSGYEPGFEEKMLRVRIVGLLPFQKERENNIVKFIYNTTNKQPFTEYIKDNELNAELIGRLLGCVIRQMKESKDYLLEPENCLLQQEYIYVGDEGRTFWLCYYPGYHQPVREQLTGLFETWMKLIDYDDTATVRLVYELYHLSRQENCTYEQILKVVNRQIVPEREEAEQMFSVNAIRHDLNLSNLIRQEMPRVPDEVLEGEAETEYYPLSCYLGVAAVAVVLLGTLILAWRGGLLLQRSGQPDAMKIICSILLFGTAGILVGHEIFRKIGKRSRMIRQTQNVSIGQTMGIIPELRNQITENTYNDNRMQNEKTPSLQECTKENDTDKQAGRTEILCEEEKTQLLYGRKRMILLPQSNHLDPIYIKTQKEILGSSKQIATIFLNYPTISRKHVQIAQSENGFEAEDLGSTNGTFVNGERLHTGRPAVLCDKDILQLAEYTYEVSIDQAR